MDAETKGKSRSRAKFDLTLTTVRRLDKYWVQTRLVLFDGVPAGYGRTFDLEGLEVDMMSDS